MSGPAPKVVVLDRDGVINEDSSEYIKSPDEWRPIAGSLEAIAALTARGFRVAVVSNQSGVGRGLFSEPALHAINRKMVDAVAAAGGRLAGIYYCPHRPEDGCDCRKPRTGLLRRLEHDLGCSLVGVPLVGDKRSDIEAADAVRARPILVRTGHGAATERALAARPGLEVFDDLAAVARAILANP